MEWIEVPSPNVGQYDTLRAVEVISRNDVWAVGESLLPDLTYLLMHWDGTGLVAGRRSAREQQLAQLDQSIREQ